MKVKIEITLTLDRNPSKQELKKLLNAISTNLNDTNDCVGLSDGMHDAPLYATKIGVNLVG